MMTRMKAVAASAKGTGLPLVVMDTAPAAVLGAMQDPVVGFCRWIPDDECWKFPYDRIPYDENEIKGVFEHHTGMLDTPKLDELMTRLGDGSLTHEEVFDDHGHGALTISNLE